MQRDSSKIQGPPNRHQFDERQYVIDKANAIQPIDAVWEVVRYNRKTRLRFGPPYLGRIDFLELNNSFGDEWLVNAIKRAEALYADTWRIGELYRSKNFKRSACRKVFLEISALYSEFSDETIDQVITDGCIMAR